MTHLDVPLNETPNPARFTGWLRELDGSKRTWQKFSDFVEMAYYAVAKTMTRDAERRDDIEDSYMRIVRTYDNKDDVRQYPKLFTYAQVAVAHYGMDFLGRVAGELGTLDPKSGQFFTPMDVSRLIAQMTMDTDFLAALIERQGFFTMQEPAAGAGGMVMALAEQVRSLDYDVLTTILCHAIEVDAFVYKMCYLQLAWAGIPAYVEHGNSLSLKHFDGVYTPAVLPFYKKHGHIFPPRPEPEEPQPERPETPETVAERYDISRAKQMSLFDFGEGE